MFQSLKLLLDQRLGSLIVQDDLTFQEGYFIKVDASHLSATGYFLKHDPDTRLTLLDTIFAIKRNMLPWKLGTLNQEATHEIIYQLKSLKLPYKIAIVIEAGETTGLIPSIAGLYPGARWLEHDLRQNYNFDIDDS